jgi:hypothetical protein
VDLGGGLGDTGMTAQDAFTGDEWMLLSRSAMVAGIAVALVGKGGPIRFAKEGLAARKVAVAPPGDHELLASLAANLEAATSSDSGEKTLGEYALGNRSEAEAALLGQLRDACAVMAAKATPEETTSWRSWMVAAAEASAEATTEGHFGRGERVSDDERDMIAKIAEAVGQGSQPSS